ncbi:MAG: hypothetical protein HYX26_07490 [Acidobacteriales bacterium]|nr:hypothetical protein [Terriglobales bacterium]
MRRLLTGLFFLCALSLPAAAAALGSTARTLIPEEVQQIIVVDYRSLNNSPTALALKDKVLPPPLKQFEQALRDAGISPEEDMEQLAFASFRSKEGLRFLGVAQGQFPGQKLALRFRKQKIRGTKYHDLVIYPMASGMSLALVDDSTMIFGASQAVKTAIDVRDGSGQSLNSNSTVLDLMNSIAGEAVWSVLDKEGANYMLKSALGDAAQLADYDIVKNRLKGARYKMSFASGVDFDLDVLTSDSVTAATLSSLMQAGVLFRKASASGAEKTALENVSVESSSSNLRLRFKSDDQKFQALLDSDLFSNLTK